VAEILIDTCVLLDVASADAIWCDWSFEQINAAIKGDGLVINPIIYAEFSLHFSSSEELKAALPEHEFRQRDLPWDAAYQAGVAHQEYCRRGGTKTAPLPDFYIGAHAAAEGYRLLTRNRKDFRSYFPDLEIISP